MPLPEFNLQGDLPEGIHPVIQNDAELKTTQERIAFFQSMLAEARRHETTENYALMSGG